MSTYRFSAVLGVVLLPALAMMAGCQKASSGGNVQQSATSSPSAEAGTFMFATAIPSVVSFPPTLNATVNGASYSNALAAGAFATFRGNTTLTDSTVAPQPAPAPGQTIHFPQILSGIQVAVGGQWAEISFAGPNQINFVIPPVTSGNKNFVIYANRAQIYQSTITVAATAPGLFTANAIGYGPPAAEACDGVPCKYDLVYTPQADPTIAVQPVALPASVAGVANTLIMFGTGWANAPKGSVKVSFDGALATPVYAGAQGGWNGLDQLNVTVPSGLAGPKAKIVNVQVQTADGSSNWTRLCLAGTAAGASKTCPVPTPAQVVNISGTGQVAPQNWPFGQSMYARVQDAHGVPIAGYPVSWADSTGTFAVRTHDSQTFTDITGVTSTYAIAQDANIVSSPLDDGPGIVTATLADPNGPALSTNYYMTATQQQQSTGISFSGYVTTQDGSTQIVVPAGTTLKNAFQGLAVIGFGAFTGKSIPNTGLYAIVQPNTDTPTPTAICTNGVDEVGTVLSDGQNGASCDLMVGPIKGQAQLVMRLYGGNDHTFNLIVQ